MSSQGSGGSGSGPAALTPPPLVHRCPLKTLQKCEIALEKLKNDMAVVRRAAPPPV